MILGDASGKELFVHRLRYANKIAVQSLNRLHSLVCRTEMQTFYCRSKAVNIALFEDEIFEETKMQLIPLAQEIICNNHLSRN